MENYPNPPEEICQRPIYLKESTVYKVMMAKIHIAGNQRDKLYCFTHHSIETRSTRDAPAPCAQKATASKFSGETVQITEALFLMCASEGGHTIENGVTAVYFAEFEKLGGKRNFNEIMIGQTINQSFFKSIADRE